MPGMNPTAGPMVASSAQSAFSNPMLMNLLKAAPMGSNIPQAFPGAKIVAGDMPDVPSLKDLLGKLGSGLQAQGGAGGGSQGFAPIQPSDPHQASTAALAAYKPMDFSQKPMIPPQILQAIMAMGGR